MKALCCMIATAQTVTLRNIFAERPALLSHLWHFCEHHQGCIHFCYLIFYKSAAAAFEHPPLGRPDSVIEYSIAYELFFAPRRAKSWLR